MIISLVIILVAVSMNYAFAELILNLLTISSSNAHYIQTFMEKIRDGETSILDQNGTCICYTLLLGSNKLNDFKNVCILSATTEYILSTERFNVPL